MSAINFYKRRTYGILSDLISKNDDKDSIFRTYKDKTTIGKEIFKELYKTFHYDKDEKKKKKNGFYMDDSQEIGILSQCQSLQALLLLPAEFGLSFDDVHIIDPIEENLSIREIMDIVIEDVIERIKTPTDGVYKFDASPYDTGRHFDVKYSNVEAITWVIPSFLQALKYHAVQGETCMWEKDLVSVISYGIKYLNDAFITSEKVGTSEKLSVGWNFTDDCEVPSLYYSFAVCECFVSFYETFKEYLDYLVAVRNIERHPSCGLEIDKDLIREYKAHLVSKEKALKKKDPGKNEFGKQLARFDKYTELVMRFTEINGGIEGIDEDSLYGTFEKNCKTVANEVWRHTKNYLADNFFFNDLYKKLSENDIAISTTSDALFNTVYIINIMLDAGLEKELILQKQIAQTDEELHKAEREYNNLLESCQIASQNAFRTYEKLKTDGKEYIVEQFLVGFNEEFIIHREKVKELRKLRMRVFTLMPLLIRTNNVISEYLIKYPQANMKKYLGYILENRYEKNNEFKWIWENDGFFSCSNYYYIAALGEFYSYYEQYESKFIKNYNDNESARAKIKEDYLEDLTRQGGDISNLKAELEEKNEKITALQNQVDNIKTPVEDAVSAVVAKEMEKLLPKMLNDFISEAAHGITVDTVDSAICAPEHKELADALKALLFAMLSERIYDSSSSRNCSQEQNIKNYRAHCENIKRDLKRCMGIYFDQIHDSDEHRSTLFD